MLTHLQDRTAPRCSRRRSHDDTRRIEPSATFQTFVVVEVRGEYGLLAVRPRSIIRYDVREDGISVGIAMLPHLGVAEIHGCRCYLTLLTILTYSVHYEAFGGLLLFHEGDK